MGPGFRGERTLELGRRPIDNRLMKYDISLRTLDGKPNPNSLYVFGFSDTDLPGYVPQVLVQ